MADKKRVLVVEDCPTLLKSYERRLTSKGYDVATVLYGGSKTKIPSERFDLVMIDGLKGDWKEVAKRVDSGKVVIVSGNPDITSEAVKEGYDAMGKSPRVLNILEEMLK